VAALITAVEATLHPFMLKWIFDEATITRDFGRFVYLCFAYLGIGVAIVLFTYVTSLWQKSLENRTLVAIEERLLRKVLSLDWKRFNQEGPGYFTSRIHKDSLEGIAPAFSLVIGFGRQVVATSVLTVVLFYLHWRAALALLLVGPPLFWAGQWIGKRVSEATSAEREEEGRFLYLLTQTLKAFEMVRGLHWLRSSVLGANRVGLKAYLDRIYQNHRLLSAQQGLSELLMNLANVASLVVGGYYVLLGELSFGGFLAFVNSFWRAVTGASSLLQRIPEFHRHGEVLSRLASLLALPAEDYASVSPHVHAQHVKVSYEGKPVLEVPHLALQAGERVLVVGPNASGKTTLLRVLAGYLKPDEGVVARPGRIACLVAPPELPPLEVRDMVKDPSLIEALDLGDRLDRQANELSSGLRQKVAIGALLSVDADLYILDEPLANLDPESKERAMELILERTSGKTLIVVLHGEEEWHGRFDRVLTLPVA